MDSRRRLPYLYENTPLFDHLRANIPQPYPRSPHEDFYVYIMGPYTAFDVSKVIDIDMDDYDDVESKLAQDLRANLQEAPYITGPAFDPDVHDGLYDTLADVRDDLLADPGVRAFLATDANIPTGKQVLEDADDDVEDPADADADYLTPLDQSIELALLSDLVVFILDESGVNNGVAAEIGEILGELNLRKRSQDAPKKPRERFRIYRSANVGSASLEESIYTYGVDEYVYDSYDDLVGHIRSRIKNVHDLSTDPDYDAPVFHGDGINGYPNDKY